MESKYEDIDGLADEARKLEKDKETAKKRLEAAEKELALHPPQPENNAAQQKLVDSEVKERTVQVYQLCSKSWV